MGRTPKEKERGDFSPAAAGRQGRVGDERLARKTACFVSAILVLLHFFLHDLPLRLHEFSMLRSGELPTANSHPRRRESSATWRESSATSVLHLPTLQGLLLFLGSRLTRRHHVKQYHHHVAAATNATTGETFRRAWSKWSPALHARMTREEDHHPFLVELPFQQY